MIPRIADIKTMPGYMLSVLFDDGKRVLYDVKEDMHLPGYGALRDMVGLFDHVQVDRSRTCIYWTEDIDLPSDTVYEYGMPIE